MFLTLTLDSYGKVLEDGTPADPAAYDYQRAARDALHFAALFDRFIQNLRRFLGYDVQYFAAVEPQKRLAPHAHIALRGTVSRVDLSTPPNAAYGRTGSTGDASAFFGWTSNRMLTTRIHKPSSGRMIDCRFSSLA